MSDYIGKVCPFCKTEFKTDDEIVVCSDCDMPHHKDCWIENQGCTTFGCLGSIKSVDGTATSVTTTELSFDDPPQTNNLTIYCTQCGSPSNNSASFCSKCGNRLTTSVMEHQTPVYEIPPKRLISRDITNLLMQAILTINNLTVKIIVMVMDMLNK